MMRGQLNQETMGLMYRANDYIFTKRRLNILKRDSMKRQQVPKYDNRCRTLTDDAVKEKIISGTPYCIRFKLTSDCQSFEDLIFGGIAYDVSLNEGDPVLMKSDGFPTYHFANVVDDHLMRITHVLRGVEWQISTTKHLLLYRAFGWSPPQFGHLPLIVNADGTKLSKRQNDVRVEDYRNKGIFPLGLVNYITSSGGGFDHVMGEGVRLKTIEELAEEFQIQKVSPHPTRLNPDLLEECNRLEIKRQLSDDNLSLHLVGKLQRIITEKYADKNLNISDEHVRNVLLWATSRISRIEDLVSSKFGFLWILPSNIDAEVNSSLLKKLIDDIECLEPFEEKSIMERLREFSSKNDIKFPRLMKMLRAVLSGLDEGPRVAEMMHLLGKSQSLQRIQAALK
ncbi:probable glutamate--tRNA ligase, mitochondrial isoform X2 [Leptidea sinapis]|uniref:probable glutamate--tRNA ligase, mitochondrial isoform X2 n=1 Tax=Leptidea sinapis TaxID=189913 RepID=UPI0021C43596|nr:probable glutamate--tRNA ligase, mitochondrial isoform X2 [Leptidea sinapis]